MSFYTNSITWWRINGPGCKYFVSNLTQVEKDPDEPITADFITGCVIDSEYVEGIQAIVHTILAVSYFNHFDLILIFDSFISRFDLSVIVSIFIISYADSFWGSESVTFFTPKLTMVCNLIIFHVMVTVTFS